MKVDLVGRIAVTDLNPEVFPTSAKLMASVQPEAESLPRLLIDLTAPGMIAIRTAAGIVLADAEGQLWPFPEGGELRIDIDSIVSLPDIGRSFKFQAGNLLVGMKWPVLPEAGLFSRAVQGLARNAYRPLSPFDRTSGRRL